MAAGQEYVVCFNTANRDQTVFPQPNNCEIQLGQAGQGSAIPNATAMYLGSVELPTTQWTIEPEWGMLPFDTGFATDVTVAGDLPNATFSFTIARAGAAPVLVSVPVPPTENPITAVAVIDPNTATFTTQWPHGLATRSEWPSISIEGTALVTGEKELTTNPTLVIIDDNNFTVSNLPGNAALIGNGYLKAAPPNPAQLAAALTVALPGVLDAALQPAGMAIVSYDPNTNYFTFVYNDGNADTLVTMTTPLPSLNSHMGFGDMATLTLTQQSSPSTALSLTVDYGASGCLGTLTFTPGNYDPDSFAAEFERAWDPFQFDGGVAMDPALREMFVFINKDALAYTVPIDYGTYTPDTFAAFLQAQMTLMDPLQLYTVTYNATTQQLTLSSSQPFGLPFNDPAVTPELVTRMGFDHVAYNGSLSYTGRPLGYSPSACTLFPKLRGGNLQLIQDAGTSTYTLQFLGAPCQPGVLVGNTVGPLAQAHGLQVGDFVRLTDGLSATYTLPVIAVPDAFTFQVDLYATGLAGNVIVCPAVATEGVLDLYFNNNSMLGDIMGFPATAAFSGADGVLGAPNCYNFHGPPYLLWIVSKPTGSTFIHHFWRAKNDNKANIFAKLILRNNTYAIERLFPMQQVLNSNPKVACMTVMVCNPDHSLYHFHGKNWSGTVVLLTSSTSGQLLSY